MDAVIGKDAFVPVNPCSYPFGIGVKVIQDLAGVALVACSENYNFRLFAENRKNFLCERPYIEPSVDSFAVRESDGQSDVCSGVEVFVAMDKSLVQVENDGLVDFLNSKYIS